MFDDSLPGFTPSGRHLIGVRPWCNSTRAAGDTSAGQVSNTPNSVHLMPVFRIFQCSGTRHGSTARNADRAVLYELRRFLAVIYATGAPLTVLVQTDEEEPGPIYENVAMTIQLILSLVALAVAIYGAWLSTHIHIRNMRSVRNNVHVTIHNLLSLRDVLDESSESMRETLTLVAVNAGQQDIVVEYLMLEVYGVAGFSPQFIGDPGAEEAEPLRPVLKLGHRLEVSFNYPHLIKWLITRPRKITLPIQVRGVLMDTLGNRFHSSWQEIGEDVPSRWHDVMKTSKGD